MSIFGNLTSMALSDLLQWAASAGKTGVLELERNGVVKRIHFRRGRVVACSSDDPPMLLGQFLLSAGKINRAQLQEGLARQQVSHEVLGRILVEMGAIAEDELTRQVAAKAEETIYGLFDWPDAAFRFVDDAPLDPNVIEVDLRVDNVLLHGMKRIDEMGRMRSVLRDPGLVPRRTGRVPPPELAEHRGASRIFDSIDGRRTIAEILLHAHASEYVALRFLSELLRGGLIELPAPEAREPGSPPPSREAHGRPAAGSAAAARGADARAGDPRTAEEISSAVRLLSQGEPEGALAILSTAYRTRPGDPSLRALIGKAEAACRESAMRLVPVSKIPVLAGTTEARSRDGLSPDESYLLSLVDGKSDVKSLLWVAPLRELDALRSLKRLVERGIIALHDSP